MSDKGKGPCCRCGITLMTEYFVYKNTDVQSEDDKYCRKCWFEHEGGKEPKCDRCGFASKEGLRDGILSMKGKKLCITCYYMKADQDEQFKAMVQGPPEDIPNVVDTPEYKNHMHMTIEERRRCRELQGIHKGEYKWLDIPAYQAMQRWMNKEDMSIGNMGWVCPVCKTVNAPMNSMCIVCHPPKIVKEG